MRRLIHLTATLALACAPATGGTETGSTSSTSAASTGPGTGSTTDPGGSTGTTSAPTTSGATGSSGATTEAANTSSASTGPASTGPVEGSSTDTTTGSTGGSTGGSTTGGPVGLAELGALVVLGDSISDGGGQPPFYYDLLRVDLEAKYGPIMYKNNAQSGSETKALLGQAKALPGQLEGPVAVVITSGGNDMKAALPQVVLGLDGPIKAQVAANVDAALGELLAPGRFGPGVEVHVYEGNIYDASDGQGNFAAGNCAFGKGLPPIQTDPFFDAWNGTIRDAVLARAQAPVDMHEHFYGHGFNNPPNWYASDCTHPSKLGHDQLRRLFYREITGEDLP